MTIHDGHLPAPTPTTADTDPHRPPSAIEVDSITKTYGRGETAVAALSGVSFTVPAGTVFGLLGPNGAGKSTTVKILTTLARADSGSARVAGIDVERDPALVRRVIGYVSQKPGFDPIGTGRENLILQGRVYGMRPAAVKRRTEELLEQLGLAQAADRRTGTWSGGMQRKLDVAMGLVHQPQVLFLDELTTGLDPEARADMWAEISRLTQQDGLTVLLTTHYLDEADQLAQRLAIIDSGRVVASGTPNALKGALGGDTVRIETAASPDPATLVVLRSVPGVSQVTADDCDLHARTDSGAAALPQILAALGDLGVPVAAVSVAGPTLDDVYLRHAGRSFHRADETGKAVAA